VANGYSRRDRGYHQRRDKQPGADCGSGPEGRDRDRIQELETEKTKAEDRVTELEEKVGQQGKQLAYQQAAQKLGADYEKS
jgi:hypothetical protein